MPFQSQAQRRKFYAMENSGEISTKMLNKWRAETPKGKKLPERVKQAAMMSAFTRELRKLAGEVDPGALQRFAKSLRPGDIIQFNTQPPDVMRTGILAGLKNNFITQSIQKVTGSAEHHTAIFAGLDPKSRKPMIVHNYDRAGKGGVTVEPLERYAKTVKLKAYRPRGVSAQQSAVAAQEAMGLSHAPTAYSRRNLLGAGVETVAEKMKNPVRRAQMRNLAANVVGKVCDPGTGICSALPVDAYQKTLGRGKAVEMFAGKSLGAEMGHVGVTPATISKSKMLRTIGNYSPMNLEKSLGGAAIKRVGDLARRGMRFVLSRGKST